MSSSAFRNESGSRSVEPISALRLGIVKEQDVSLARLRVTFNEFDQMLSYWLPVVVPKTQNDKAYWLPDIGEQVVCLMDARDEAGVVLGAIYSQADATPVQNADKFHLGFKDGTSIEYDRASHVLGLSFQDTSAFKYDSGAHALTLNFADQASIKYDASAHSLVINFSDGAAIEIRCGGSCIDHGGRGRIVRNDKRVSRNHSPVRRILCIDSPERCNN